MEGKSIGIMDIVNKLISLLVQNSVCWSCGLDHNGKNLICEDCHSALKMVIEPCWQCGLSHKGETKTCVQCLSHPKLWQHMIAPLSYASPISQVIQRLKYNQKLDVLKSLIELVIPMFQAVEQKPQILIPVPLHQNRYIERGFNQSFEISTMLSKALGISCSDALVARIVDTKRQSELTLKQRKDNIKNAFFVNNKLSDYDHIVIVDDVITSGSTVHELVRQCLKKGVKRVDVWALARTEKDL